MPVDQFVAMMRREFPTAKNIDPTKSALKPWVPWRIYVKPTSKRGWRS